MSITRLQQARQMYATGQRVAKTLDGSRPGYQGPHAGGYGSSNSQGPAGGSSAGGNYGGDSSGGVSARDMSNTRNEGPAGSRPGPQNTVDPGFQNALNAAAKRQATIKASQDPNYGQFFNTRVPVHTTPTLGQRIGQGIGNFASGVGDYISSGGIWGAAARGLGSLFSGIGLKSNLARRKDFMTKYNTSVPPSERLDMTEDDILSAEGLDALKELGYKTISDMPTGPQNDGGMPFWAQLGYPSYEAWASAQNQSIDNNDDETEEGVFEARFLPDNTPEERARKEAIEKAIMEKFSGDEWDWDSFSPGDMGDI